MIPKLQMLPKLPYCSKVLGRFTFSLTNGFCPRLPSQTNLSLGGILLSVPMTFGQECCIAGMHNRSIQSPQIFKHSFPNA